MSKRNGEYLTLYQDEEGLWCSIIWIWPNFLTSVIGTQFKHFISEYSFWFLIILPFSIDSQYFCPLLKERWECFLVFIKVYFDSFFIVMKIRTLYASIIQLSFFCNKDFFLSARNASVVWILLLTQGLEIGELPPLFKKNKRGGVWVLSPTSKTRDYPAKIVFPVSHGPIALFYISSPFNTFLFLTYHCKSCLFRYTKYFYSSLFILIKEDFLPKIFLD